MSKSPSLLESVLEQELGDLLNPHALYPYQPSDVWYGYNQVSDDGVASFLRKLADYLELYPEMILGHVHCEYHFVENEPIQVHVEYKLIGEKEDE